MPFIHKIKTEGISTELLDPIDIDTYEAYKENRLKIDELIALNNRLVDLALQKANDDLRNRPTGKLIYLVSSAYSDRKARVFWEKLKQRNKDVDYVLKAPERLGTPVPASMQKQCHSIIHTLKQNKSVLLWTANTYIFRGLQDAYWDGILTDVEVYEIEDGKLIEKQPNEADGFDIGSYKLSF